MERREPTISTLSPSPEELKAKSRQAQPSKVTQRAGNSGGQQSSARPVVVKSSPLTPIAFLVAFAALGLAGFSYWQQMQATKSRVSAEVRIAELEGKLDLTGDESAASLTAVQAKLKWADAEIRKLWGVSHDTNRKLINTNKSKLAGLAKQLKSQEVKLSGSLNKALSSVDGVKSQMDSVNQKSSQRQTQVEILSDRLTQLEDSEAALRSSITEHEQAIAAIDSFRRKVNQDLLVLKNAASNTP